MRFAAQWQQSSRASEVSTKGSKAAPEQLEGKAAAGNAGDQSRGSSESQLEGRQCSGIGSHWRWNMVVPTAGGWDLVPKRFSRCGGVAIGLKPSCTPYVETAFGPPRLSRQFTNCFSLIMSCLPGTARHW